MRKTIVRCCCIVALTAAISTASVADRDPARRYKLVNLDAATGMTGISPVAINDDGIVALRAFENGSVVSALYESKSGQIVQRFPQGQFINAVSNSGNTAGQSAAGAGWFVVHGVAGTVPFGGGTGSGGMAVNDRGQVAGFIVLPQGFFGSAHAILYSNATGELTDLGTLGGTSSNAFAVNDRGQVAGFSNINPNDSPFFPTQHAFRYEDGVMQDLGTLGGDSSNAFAIDKKGRVAGFAQAVPGRFAPRHGFLFDEDGMHDLGTLPGRSDSEASAMNDHGDVVGNSSFGGLNTAHAVLFRKGQVIDLNDDVAPPPDGFILQNATGINDRGAIIGMSRGPNFALRAFLLLPVEGDED
jgi:probable HAF family extracellular repeat protein